MKTSRWFDEMQLRLAAELLPALRAYRSKVASDRSAKVRRRRRKRTANKILEAWRSCKKDEHNRASVIAGKLGYSDTYVRRILRENGIQKKRT